MIEIPQWIIDNNTPEHIAKLQGLSNEPDDGDYGVIVLGKTKPIVHMMGVSYEEAVARMNDIEDGDPEATVFMFKTVEPLEDDE